MLLNDRDQIIAMTAEWTGERYPNGRPRVSDEKIEILKNLTQEEIWQPLYSCGYRFQFQGDLKPLHPDKKLYGRAVTCCFMPQRPDLRQHVFNVARSRGWKGDCNQWVIDSLEESDVVVCDLYDKILRGTFVGGNLTTAVKARTKNGGVVVWGGVRDLEQMQNIDVQVFYRGVDPTPIRDCQITAFNGPCRIGAAICLPGDIVIGTKNGILFVPSHTSRHNNLLFAPFPMAKPIPEKRDFPVSAFRYGLFVVLLFSGVTVRGSGGGTGWGCCPSTF